jgi:hypothetical protein
MCASARIGTIQLDGLRPHRCALGRLAGFVTVARVGLEREKVRSDLPLLQRHISIPPPLRLGGFAAWIERSDAPRMKGVVSSGLRAAARQRPYERSCRAVTRMAGASKNTIIKLLKGAGEAVSPALSRKRVEPERQVDYGLGMSSLSYRGQHAIWLYLRFSLSYREVEELLTRGARGPAIGGTWTRRSRSTAGIGAERKVDCGCSASGFAPLRSFAMKVETGPRRASGRGYCGRSMPSSRPRL